MTAGYWVIGVQLVNVGGELCSACEKRPAVGASIGGSAVCARCAGRAATDADEYAREVEASERRRHAKGEDDRARVQRAIARLEGHTAAQSDTPVVSENAIRKTGIQRRARVDAAAKANLEKSHRQRGIRHAAVMGVLDKQNEPCSSSALALLTGLSLATIKRALSELTREKRVKVTRLTSASTFLYRVAGDDR